GRLRCVEDGAWKHSLRQIVEPLESLAIGGDERARVPQSLEHRLRRLPVPHPALGRALEMARAEWAARADLVQDLVREMRMGPLDLAVPLPTAVLHRRGEARPVLGR